MTQKSPSKIWVLFSVENNYDQPDNNLVCWWSERPSIETLTKTLGWDTIEAVKDDAIIVNIVNIWGGKAVQLNGPGTTLYRVEEIEEGKCI